MNLIGTVVYADGVRLLNFHYDGHCRFECTKCGARWDETVPVRRGTDNVSCVHTEEHRACVECKKIDALADALFERLVGPMAIRIAERLRS